MKMKFKLNYRNFWGNQRSLLQALTFIIGLSFSINAQPILHLEQYASGNLNNIVGLSHAGDERLFAVLQSGIIRVIEEDGNVILTPFLNVSTQISTGGE